VKGLFDLPSRMKLPRFPTALSTKCTYTGRNGMSLSIAVKGKNKDDIGLIAFWKNEMTGLLRAKRGL